MPINGFTVGRDVAVIINTPEGIKRFSLITNFNSKPTVSGEKIKGLDGITRNVPFHEGWTGQFDIERQDSEVDDYWAQIEENYHQGVNIEAASITETISEANGGISQFRYENVTLTLEDAGDKKGNSTVKQRMSFFASRRKKI